MGVHTSFYVGAKEHFRPTAERLEALVADLVTRDFVKMPCAVVVGKEMRLDAPPGLDDFLWRPNNELFQERNDWPIKHSYGNSYSFEDEDEMPEDILIYYAGQSEQALRETVRGLASEMQDICLYFSGLSFDHGQTSEGSEVFIFSLAQPAPLVCVNAYSGKEEGEKHLLQYVVNVEGKYGMWELDETPLEPIIIHHLGHDLVIDCSFT